MDSSAFPPDAEPLIQEGIKESLPIILRNIPVAFAPSMNAGKSGFTPPETLFFFGIASRCAVLAMPRIPESGLRIRKTYRIIFPMLLSAFAYGIAWKLLAEG